MGGDPSSSLSKTTFSVKAKLFNKQEQAQRSAKASPNRSGQATPKFTSKVNGSPPNTTTEKVYGLSSPIQRIGAVDAAVLLAAKQSAVKDKKLPIRKSAEK